MYSKPDLINAACDYAERSERLREQYRTMSLDYLKGRIDQYDEGLLPNLPLVGRLFIPQEIRVMKSVLEEKLKN
tara:strand:- start:886 stop:1107 length:222 start_codon:yes stop_codon:yes gene_type:complete